MGITERADILVDFSQFPAGTQIIMRNTHEITDPETGETIVADPNVACVIVPITGALESMSMPFARDLVAAFEEHCVADSRRA